MSPPDGTIKELERDLYSNVVTFLSQPSVGVVGSYDAQGQSQPTLRVAGTVAGGAAAHQGPASKM